MDNTTMAVWAFLLVLGCFISAIFVNRVMFTGGKAPGYLRSLAVVIFGFLLIALFPLLTGFDANPLALLVSTGLLILLTGQIYRVILGTANQKLSYGKSVLVAFGSFLITVTPAFLITMLLEEYGLIAK